MADLRNDNRRSNRIQVGGQIVLRFDWYQVAHQGNEVLELVRLGLEEAAAMETVHQG